MLEIPKFKWNRAKRDLARMRDWKIERVQNGTAHGQTADYIQGEIDALGLAGWALREVERQGLVKWTPLSEVAQGGRR